MRVNDCGRGHPDEALVSPCARCGAPICCSWCCELDEKDRRIEQLEKAQRSLKATMVKEAAFLAVEFSFIEDEHQGERIIKCCLRLRDAAYPPAPPEGQLQRIEAEGVGDNNGFYEITPEGEQG